jgi:hypothetical protein
MAFSPQLLYESRQMALGPYCPKELGGDSFRAMATLRDKCSGQVNVTADMVGGGFNATVLPQTHERQLAPFPDPEIVAYRLIQAFRYPDRFGEWFYREMSPDARMTYGGRNGVQFFLSSPHSVMKWLGHAHEFRVKRFMQDFRNVEATLDIEIKFPEGGSMVYVVAFKRNDQLDTYLQEPPAMDWRIHRMFPLVTQ